MEKNKFLLSAKSMNRYTSESFSNIFYLRKNRIFIHFSSFEPRKSDFGQNFSDKIDGKKFQVPGATFEEKKFEQDFTVFLDIEWKNVAFLVRNFQQAGKNSKLCVQKNILGNINSLQFSNLWYFRTSSEKFADFRQSLRQGCQNCILPVQGNNLVSKTMRLSTPNWQIMEKKIHILKGRFSSRIVLR